MVQARRRIPARRMPVHSWGIDPAKGLEYLAPAMMIRILNIASVFFLGR
jgi:hypothetical protein